MKKLKLGGSSSSNYHLRGFGCLCEQRTDLFLSTHLNKSFVRSPASETSGSYVRVANYNGVAGSDLYRRSREVAGFGLLLQSR